MGKKIRLTFLLIVVLIVCVVVGLFVLQSPPRVQRDHAETIPQQYQFLTNTITFSKAPEEKWLSAKKAADDLDELEWLLENCYSYLHRKDVDYKTALDAVRLSVKDRIKRSQLAWKINKVLALFGDGHTGVRDPAMRWTCRQHLPFLIGEYQGRYFAFKEDRSGFIDSEYPYLTEIQGLPAVRWLEVAKQSVPDASSQFVNTHAVRRLKYYGIFSRELELDTNQSVQVKLESEDGHQENSILLTLVKERPEYGSWPQRESGVLGSNIGYLRLAPFMDFQKEFQEMLVQTMNDFKDTQGLIIDIRGNGGGARAPLKTLFPFFMKPDDQPHIVNVAAYRTGIGANEGDRRFKLRFLYPVDSSHWTRAERAVIQKHVEVFQPEWMPPQGQFSPWHYFVISPINNERYYYYDKPVVIIMESWNFSACDIFLSAFKEWSNVTLIGTPSGGGSGSANSYYLHHSDIRLKLSTMASFRTNGLLYDGNGVQPDIFCEPIPTDYIGQSDTLLDKAIEIIGKND